MSLAVRLEHVSFAYGHGPPVLRDVSLGVQRGEFVAIAGPNGGGKTTLLRLVLGLEQPISGRVEVDARPVAYLPQRALEGQLPAHLRDTVYTKEHLAESFAALTRRRFGPEFGKLHWSCYGATFHRPADIGHWLEVMASVLKLARQPDISGAALLLQHTHDTPTNVA